MQLVLQHDGWLSYSTITAPPTTAAWIPRQNVASTCRKDHRLCVD